MFTIPSDCIKIFPEYEDVFFDDIENHKKYFLPLCSINLNFASPHTSEWLHFVSVKEIFDGRVGETTAGYHTRYTKPDMIGFDIIDGKYKFDSPWEYFSVTTEISPGNYSQQYTEEEIAFNVNEALYNLIKEYYNKYGHIIQYFYWPGIDDFTVRSLQRIRDTSAEEFHNKWAEEAENNAINGVINSLFCSPLQDQENHGYDPDNPPLNKQEQPFEYIGSLDGSKFQRYAADDILLFRDKSEQKAIIKFNYT